MTTPQAIPESCRAASTLEVLEARIAPAVTSPGLVTYTDADGDTVKVQVAGSFDSVELLNVDGADVVVAGGDLKSIVVTGAGSDFSLTFADGNSGPNSGDGVISLGVISGPAGAKLPAIKGVYTVQTDGAATFELGGYKGVGFSKGGGLQIHGSLVAVADGTGGLEVDKIRAGAVINLRDGVEAGTLLSVKREVAGTLSIGGEIDSSILIGKVSGTVQLGTVSSTVTLDAAFKGRLSVEETTFNSELGEPVGQIWLKSALRSTGIVTAGDRLNLQVDQDLSGTIRVQGDLFLNAGNRLNDTNVTVGANLTLKTAGAVLRSTVTVGGMIEGESQIGGGVKDSSITSFDDLTLHIAESVTNSRIVTSDEGLITVGGFLLRSEVTAGSDLAVSVVEYITKSEVLPDGSLVLQVSGAEKASGSVVDSVIGSREGALEAAIAGKVTGNDFIVYDGAFVAVGRGWSKNVFSSGFDADVTVLGQVTKSSFVSGSDLRITTERAILDSQLLPANDLIVNAGSGGISGTRMETAEGDVTIESTGKISKAVVLAARHAALTTEAGITSNVLIHATQDVAVSASTQKIAALIAAGRDVVISSAGEFSGAIRAGEDLTVSVAKLAPVTSSRSIGTGLPSVQAGIHVGGNLALQTSSNVKASVIDVDGDLIELRVGGNFAANLNVGKDLILGESGSEVTAIAGKVSAKSVIQVRGDIGNAESAAKVTFAGAFGGHLQLAGDLRTDLEFQNSVALIDIGGSIGNTDLGDGIAQILVNGSVGSLRTGSVFVRADAGGGSFVDGAGVITGTLQASGRADKVMASTLV